MACPRLGTTPCPPPSHRPVFHSHSPKLRALSKDVKRPQYRGTPARCHVGPTRLESCPRLTRTTHTCGLPHHHHNHKQHPRAPRPRPQRKAIRTMSQVEHPSEALCVCFKFNDPPIPSPKGSQFLIPRSSNTAPRETGPGERERPLEVQRRRSRRIAMWHGARHYQALGLLPGAPRG